MTTDTALIEKREELKRRLAAGEYKTLVDVFLEWFERLLRKITRRTKPLPTWYITVILYFVVNLIGFAAAFVTFDMTIVNLIGVLAFIAMNILPIVSAVVINQYIGRIMVFWRNDILDSTESLASLEEFKNWLEKIYNRRLNLLVIIIGGSLGGLYLMTQIPESYSITSNSFTFWVIIVNLFNWSIIYQLIMVILLSTRLRRYDLRLFPSDPASSELISRLSSLLGFVVYFVAVFAALFTLTFALVGFLPYFGGSLVLFFWIPIIALFLSNQTSLSGIIRRVKWKTLNEIQVKVEKLQAVENFEDKETMEAINRLMDYHDRVKATRDSALDFRTYLGFFNSLLLPLLAFILGNLDLVLQLFGRKP